MNRRRRYRVSLAALLSLTAACGGSSGAGGFGGHPSSSSSSQPGGGGQGGHGGSAVDPASLLYPDLETLHAGAVASTCALNQGVCHSQREYPELGSLAALTSLVGAPCQLGKQDPKDTLDACETAGDRLALGTQDLEILEVLVADTEPYPPATVTLKVGAAFGALDPSTARIHRSDGMGGDLLSRPLTGATLTPGNDVVHIVVGLAGATDTTLASFLDVRAYHGDRVRQGDPNGDGVAHASPMPWAEIHPGDPARSMLYQRLLKTTHGPLMPLIQRTWSALATRAVWCWIRGLPPGEEPSAIDPKAPIDYASCPLDPEAPDPGASGGWPAVGTLMKGKCATGPCHSTETHSAMLDLTPTPAVFAAEVINVASVQAPGSMLVVPGQPAASYLLCKVDPACSSRAAGTELMPQGASALSKTEIKILSDWILAGSPTN